MSNEFPFLLNGEWLREGERVEIRSPYDQSVVGATWNATPQHLEQAIDGSVRAFAVTKKMASHERQSVLRKVAQQLETRKEEIARTIAAEAGKPIKTARIEVERGLMIFTIAAEEAVRISGEVLPLDRTAASAGQWGIVRRFPVGPIAAITPFNFPFILCAHKIAPAIAAGCTVVLKPAPQTPMTALLLGQMVQEAGWPAGGLNVMPLRNEDAGQLVNDDRLKMLSFTGSAAVGWQLKSQCGKKKVVLELGGNAGCIVHKDADIAD